MVIIENNKVKELETIIKKSDRQLVDILRKILNIQVDKIIIEKRLKLKNISEYEFEVIKTKAKLENDNEVEIYFKPIKNSRIKESIFCYWCLIYEEEISDKKIHPERDIFLNKVLISELTKKKYYQSVFLEIENNKGHMLENGTEINFIEILKYLKEESCEGCEELKNYFEKMQDYVLLAGIKINRKNKKAIYLDEIWRLIGVTSNKEVASFIYKIFKTIRKYGGSGVAITQDISDLFSLENGIYGKSILSNSSIKSFFLLEEDNIKILSENVNLSEKEKIEIKSLKRGESLMFIGDSHVLAKVECSELEKKIIE